MLPCRAGLALGRGRRRDVAPQAPRPRDESGQAAASVSSARAPPLHARPPRGGGELCLSQRLPRSREVWCPLAPRHRPGEGTADVAPVPPRAVAAGLDPQAVGWGSLLVSQQKLQQSCPDTPSVDRGSAVGHNLRRTSSWGGCPQRPTPKTGALIWPIQKDPPLPACLPPCSPAEKLGLFSPLLPPHPRATWICSSPADKFGQRSFPPSLGLDAPRLRIGCTNTFDTITLSAGSETRNPARKGHPTVLLPPAGQGTHARPASHPPNLVHCHCRWRLCAGMPCGRASSQPTGPASVQDWIPSAAPAVLWRNCWP